MSGDKCHESDCALVASFKERRDGTYFAALFDRHQKRIFSVAYGIMRNSAIAEEIVQETFTRAFRQIEGFDERDPRSNFPAWLARICRNACLDELRKKRVRSEYQSEAAQSEEYAPKAEEEIDFGDHGHGHRRSDQEQALLFRELYEELRRIDQDKRTCWLLFQVEGYSYNEIAEMLGLSFEEVKARIQSVSRRLRKMFV